MKKITKRDIDNKIIYSLFDFQGYTDNPKTALNRIISDCKENNIPYTLSHYAEKILNS